MNWLAVFAAVVVAFILVVWVLPWVPVAWGQSRDKRAREAVAAAEMEEERRRKFAESLQPPRREVTVKINADTTAFMEGIKKAIAATETVAERTERAAKAYLEAQVCAELELIEAGLELASDRFQMTVEEAAR